MKVEFLSPLLVENIGESHDRLIADFSAEYGQLEIVVPAGFVTDYDSVPRIPFAYWLLGGKRHKAAVLHDFLYSAECPAYLYARGRAWADAVYRCTLKTEGVGAIRAQIMYLGVRVGGAAAYKAGPTEENQEP